MSRTYGIKRACRVFNLSKGVYYYQGIGKEDSELERALLEKAERHSEEGFRITYHRLPNESRPWNQERLHLIYVKLAPQFLTSAAEY